MKPHVSVLARVKIINRSHVVHKSLVETGCDEDSEDSDLEKITMLGIDCTYEEINRPPSIDEVISKLETLKVGKSKA